MVEFQSQNRSTITRQELAALEDALAEVEISRYRLRSLLRDIETLDQELAERRGDEEAGSRADLMALMVTLRALRGGPGLTTISEASIPESGSPVGARGFGEPLIQLQVGELQLEESGAQQRQYLQRLLRRVAEELDTLDTDAENLTEMILERQRLVESLDREQQLRKELSLAEETYEALHRKAQEASLASDS